MYTRRKNHNATKPWIRRLYSYYLTLLGNIMMITEFDPIKHYLGKLCIHGHEYQDTGKSLRTHKKWECVGCKSDRDRKYREQNREKVLQSKKNYYENNKEKFQQWAEKRKTDPVIKSQTKEYHKRYKLINRDRIRERSQQYDEMNRDRNRASRRRHYRENKELVRERQKKYVNQPKKNYYTRQYRARKRGAQTEPYTAQDIQTMFELWSDRCAYCYDTLEGKRKRQVDHFYPLNSGGKDALSNLLPACISCNSSKCDRLPYTWYVNQPFFHPERMRRIKIYLGLTD